MFGRPTVKLSVYVAFILSVGLLPLWLNFGNEVLEIDFISQQIPFILETKRMFATGAPWWSWNTFAGDNFIGAYSFYTVTSPFVWLCCCFSAKRILWGILLSLYLKTICTSIFAYAYLRKMNLSQRQSMAGGLMYAFSSFYVCNLFYFHFCEPLMLLPLLLIALERVIRGESRCCFWLALITFAVVAVNFYFAFSTLLLGLIYFIARGCAARRMCAGMVLRGVGTVCVGILMASVILFPVIMHHIGAPKAHASYDMGAILGYSLTNPGGIAAQILPMLRALMMPKVTEGIPHAFVASNDLITSTECFVPVFGLFLALIYIHRNRRSWLSVVILLLLAIYLTPLNGIFTMYTKPLYNRWLYGLVLMLILASVRMMEEPVCVSRRAYAWYLGVCALIVAVSLVVDMLGSGMRFELTSIKAYDLVQFAVNMGLLYLWLVSAKCRRHILLVIALSATLQMAGFTYFNFGHGAKDLVSARIESNMMFACERPLSEDGCVAGMRFRTDHVSGYRNFSLMQNKPGIYGFHSSVNVKMCRIKKFASGNDFSPTFASMKAREPMATLFSVRDVYLSHDTLTSGMSPYESGLTLAERGIDFDRYTFGYYIPMGFTYDSFVTEDEFMAYYDEHPDADAPLLMLDNLVVRSEDSAAMDGLLRHGRVSGDVALDSIVSRRRRTVAGSFVGDSRGYRCTTDFDSARVVFFSVVADPGFSARIDGVHVPIYEVNFGLSAMMVPAGCHTIEVGYFPAGLRAGIAGSVVGMLLLLGMLLVGRWKGRRTRRVAGAAENE